MTDKAIVSIAEGQDVEKLVQDVLAPLGGVLFWIFLHGYF